MMDKSKDLSLNAMKFGSEEDFKIAITELKWIIHALGKATERDFEVVSSKYNFPIGFLKQGLKGLAFPEDYKISKSKWFPILYNWKFQRREKSYRLFRLRIDYLRSKFSSISIFVMLIFISIATILYYYILLLDFLTLSLLIITFVLFFIALFFEMKNPLADKKIALDEYSYLLKQKGLWKIIEDTERFLKSHSKIVIYAGDILKKKLESAPEVTVFASHLENGTLIADDWEDPDLEYKKRISELGKT